MHIFTYVGWQVILCDPIWQMTLRSSVMDFLLKNLHRNLPFPLPCFFLLCGCHRPHHVSCPSVRPSARLSVCVLALPYSKTWET